MPQRRSKTQQRGWQQQLLQQLFSQPQLCSQQQLFSQPQLCSQQQLFSQQLPHPQPWKQLQRRSRMQQPPPQQQVLQQPCSQPQLCSQQLQLGSQQQPQPEPSILSNKPKPKLGLVRAMLTMSAPKNLFIGRRLLYVGTLLKQKISRLPATRDAAPRRV